MPRQIDPKIAEILKGYGADPTTSCWDCHGTFVIYHKTLEMVATKAGIAFENPIIIEADTEKKIAVISVNGHTETMSAWSVGEAAPYNNKNAYPWAMAEKRAKDRVILKLLGLSGYVYSEDEADDFKKSRDEADDSEESPPPKPSKPEPKNAKGVGEARKWAEAHKNALMDCADADEFIGTLNDSKARWVKIISDYPGVWEGPENSGLRADVAKTASVFGVVDSYETFLDVIEGAAADAKP